MKLAIENTLGIVSAEIDIEAGKIVEVVGPNASGKTSLAVCAQAVLARESNPLGLSVADAKRCYPHDGAEDARVTIVDDIRCSETDWYPSRGTITAPGIEGRGTASVPMQSGLPLSRPEAVGLIDFTAKRGAKERAAVFQGALLPDPMTVLNAVHERLATYIPADDLAGAMKMLEERGWEATASIYSEFATKGKQEWRAITAKNYGVRVAADWRPDGWLADYDHLTVQQAEEAVTDARDALNGLHRVQAVSEADAERAKQAEADIPVLKQRIDDMQEQRRQVLADRDAIPETTATLEVKRLDGELDALRRELTARLECPHCCMGIAIVKGAIVPARSGTVIDAAIGVQEADRYVAVERVLELQGQAKPLSDKLAVLDRSLKDESTAYATATRDAKNAGQVQTAADAAALAAAEQSVEDVREVVRLVAAEADAGKLHETIVRYTEIAKALGPEGVRAKMLEDGLKKLNAGLVTIAVESGWPCTTVGAGTSGVFVGDRPVALCSESERWRAQAALQLTLGAITGSKAVVLDRADLLDGTNRQGLAAAVKRVVGKTGMAVLLCSTSGNAGVGHWPQVFLEAGRTA